MARGDFKDKSKASIAGKKSKRGKGRLTLLREALEASNIKKIKNIDDLKQSNLENLLILRHSAKKFYDKFIIEKELLKYLQPQKREHSGEIGHKVNVTINYGKSK